MEDIKTALTEMSLTDRVALLKELQEATVADLKAVAAEREASINAYMGGVNEYLTELSTEIVAKAAEFGVQFSIRIDPVSKAYQIQRLAMPTVKAVSGQPTVQVAAVSSARPVAVVDGDEFTSYRECAAFLYGAENLPTCSTNYRIWLQSKGHVVGAPTR